MVWGRTESAWRSRESFLSKRLKVKRQKALDSWWPPKASRPQRGRRAGAGGRPSAFVLQTVLVPGEVLPTAFEASEKWPNLIHEPLDQGNCAGSWAFSTAGAHEGWLGGEGGRGLSPLTALLLLHQPWLPIASPSILWGTWHLSCRPRTCCPVTSTTSGAAAVGIWTAPGGSCDGEGEQQGAWAGKRARGRGLGEGQLPLPLLPPAAPPGLCPTTATRSRAGRRRRQARRPPA